MSRGYSRKRHARGRKHKSMRKHKRSMHKRSMHKRSMRRHKSRHGRKSMRRHKTRKLGRGYGPPGDSPDVRPRDMARNENMTFPDSTALDTWRGYNRNNYSQSQWNAHVSAIVDAIENGELDEDATTQAEYADVYREMTGR